MRRSSGCRPYESACSRAWCALSGRSRCIRGANVSASGSSCLLLYKPSGARARRGGPSSGIIPLVMPAPEDALARGRRALAAADWTAARAAFDTIVTVQPEDPVALDGLSEALWWTGDWARARELREKAFVRHKALSRPIDAARAAIWLGNEYFVAHGNRAAWNGWLERAASLLEGAPRCAEHGWLIITRGRRAEDPNLALRASEDTLAMARELGDVDLEAFALSQLGRALVALGRAEEGFARLDAAMASVTAGELRSHAAVSETCCNMLVTCEGAAEMDRLIQWCRVADDISRHLKGKTVYAACRYNHASVLIARGRWAEAEEELRAAIEISAQVYPSYTVNMLARLASLRVAQGRLAEAEELLAGHEEFAGSVTAVARVKIAKGEGGAAAKLLRRRLSQLHEDQVQSAPLNALLVEALLSCGDVEAARKAAVELAENARHTGRAACLAAAQLALGMTALAGGDPDGDA